MIWTDETHDFHCLDCPHRAGPCLAALGLARHLAQALAQAAPFTTPDFEVAGVAHLKGCAKSCAAAFVASKRAVRIYCDAQPGPEADRQVSPSGAVGADVREYSQGARREPDPAPSLVIEAKPHRNVDSAPTVARGPAARRADRRRRLTA